MKNNSQSQETKCNGCGAITTLNPHKIKVLGGEWRDDRLCDACLESVTTRPNQKHLDLAKPPKPQFRRAVDMVWQSNQGLSPGINPMGGWDMIGTMQDEFNTKYADHPMSFTFLIDHKVRYCWRSPWQNPHYDKNMMRRLSSLIRSTARSTKRSNAYPHLNLGVL